MKETGDNLKVPTINESCDTVDNIIIHTINQRCETRDTS